MGEFLTKNAEMAFASAVGLIALFIWISAQSSIQKKVDACIASGGVPVSTSYAFQGCANEN